MPKPIPFLTSFFLPPEISSLWRTSIAITPFGTQKVLLTPMRRKYSIGSPSLNDPDKPTFLHRSSLTSPSLPPLLPYLALGRYFRIWALITYQSFYLSLFLRSFTPISVPHPSICRKLAGITLPFTLTLTVLLQRNTRVFLFPLLLLSLLLRHRMRPNLPSLSTASNAILKPGSPLK